MEAIGFSSTLPGELESLDYLEGHKPRGPTDAIRVTVMQGDRLDTVTPATIAQV